MIYYSKRPQDQQPQSKVLNYLYDSCGNRATHCLFVDQLPYNILESEIRQIFERYAPVNIVIGNKQLKVGEYRTALVYFATVEQAVICRSELQNHKVHDHAMVINFRR